MKLTRCVFVLALAGCAVSPSDGGLDDIPQHPTSAVCSGGRLKCFAIMQTDTVGISPHASGSSGFGPSDLASAYKLDTSLSPGATIAIVDAYDYANAESDLASYRSKYGLPACTTSNGCFKRVNQDGNTSPLPSAAPSNDDWTVEAALDLDMASAACPKCKLILVEADDDQGDGLFIANNGAASLHPTVISNSWGGPESGSESSYEHYFDHAGIGIFVAAGDSGYDDGGQGPDYPSTSAHVTGVGGTSLAKSSSSRGWSEKAWSDGGSSCSTSIAKPSYQTSTACSKHMTSDVSAVADPNTGVAVYNAANGGWIVVGGTSAASPFVAAVYALYGLGGQAPGWSYNHATAFFDVSSGSNGSCAAPLCKAGTGWDGPTGMGTPDGAALGGGSGSGSGTGTGAFALTVSSTTVSLAPGGSKQITVNTTVTSGSAESVALSVTGLPSGVTASFASPTITAGHSTTLTLSASSTAAAVSGASIRVYAKSASVTHYRSVSVSVSGSGSGTGTGDFSLSLSNNHITLSAGGSSSVTLTTAVTSGSAETITLSATSLPAGVTASFGSTTVTAGHGTTVTFHASSSAASVSSDQVRIYGTSSDQSHYKIGYVTVD